MSIAIHVIRLRCLWARIHASLYSGAASCHADQPPHNTHVGQLRGELDEWLASMPPIPPRRGAALTIFATREWFDLKYNYVILLLYRGQVIKHGGVTDAALAECLQAARRICDGYRRQYIGRPVNYTWGALHFLFTAGLTYLHCLWAAPPAARDAVRYDEISRTCSNCTVVLVVMAERWLEAAPYRDIFEALAGRTLAMMVDRRGQGQPAGTGSPATAGGLDPGDLSQWMADIADSGVSGGIDELLADITGGIAPSGVSSTGQSLAGGGGASTQA